MAERLGMTVDELEGRMSSLELSEWMILDRIVAAEREAASKARKGA